MMNPMATPSTISPAPVVTRVDVLGELGGLVTVIWTFLPLVEGSSGNEMLYDPRSFPGILMSSN